MSNSGRIKGILFDMDNTLLQSRIDFPAMKRGVFDFFAERKALPGDFPIDAHTTATMLEHVKTNGGDDALIASALAIAAKHELAGMAGAGLEPGARELLEALDGRFPVVVVTNNAYAAAVSALESTGILQRFDLVVGREQMTAMKPSSSGFRYAMERFSGISAEEWLSVGDSWIDGKASAEAGIPFISYRTPIEAMVRQGARPKARIDHLLELLALIG